MPAFSLSGTFGFLVDRHRQLDLGDAFDWKSRVVSFGPAVVWNVLNYGQITNQVRDQDASFQAAVLSYQNTVLQAQQEVEDGLASFLGAQETRGAAERGGRGGAPLGRSGAAQYRAGAASYTTVLTAQQNLLHATGPAGGHPRQRRAGADLALPRARRRLGDPGGSGLRPRRHQGDHGQAHQLGRAPGRRSRPGSNAPTSPIPAPAF